MSTSQHVCEGLRGSDPLGALASFGLLLIAERAGFAPKLSFSRTAAWRPVIETTATQAQLVEAVVAVLVGHEAAALRVDAEALEYSLRAVQSEQKSLQEEPAVTGPARKQRSARLAELKAEITRLKAEWGAAQVKADQATKAGVLDRHPVTGLAVHLDDISKGGLSRENLALLASAPDAAPYLHGLACAVYAAGKKTLLARSALSFSNNNSGKQLLKDFAAIARLITGARVEDALFGSARRFDFVTGLGWDPGSQKSYALQFDDPAKGNANCNATHHALAFYGLAMFPVVPLLVDRTTVGVYALAAERPEATDEEDDDEGDTGSARSRRLSDQFTWPLWEMPLALPVVQGLLACAEFAQAQPDVQRCRAMGVAAVLRSRRFVLNKRSYLAPARPVA